MLVDVVMPKMGESVAEATIIKWVKNEGDKIKIDETVLEIATDKVDSEVPSTTEGILEEILYRESDVVPIGKVIARIKANDEANKTVESPRPSLGSSEQYEEANMVEDEIRSPRVA